MKIAVDTRTSTLIVWAPQDIQKKVAELVKNIDMLPVREESIKIFTLINVDPDSAAKALRTIVPQVRLAAEQRTGSLIGKGPAEALNVVEAALTKLDEYKGGVYTASYEVRVVWLASGLTGDAAGATPADDLKDVVAELSRHGIKDPRQVGELSVQTTVVQDRGGSFQVKGSPFFGAQPVDFNASGHLSELSAGTIMARVKISTKKALAAGAGPTLNEFETETVLPNKQYVVLAAAPAGNQSSAFVLQVVRRENAGEKKDKR